MNNENSLDKVASKRDEWHRTILRAAMDGFWVMDLEGRLLEVNDAYCRMTGFSEQELLTMGVSDLEALETEEMIASHIGKIVEQGEDRFETRHCRKDGSIFDVEVSAQYRIFDGGRICAFIRDITDPRQVEKEREQFFKFFQTSADLMCIADPSGRFIRTNPAFSETLGYSEAELVSKPFMEFVHPDDRQATLDEIARQIESGFTRNFDNRYLCRNGSVKWLSWRARYDRDDGIAYATARDITDRKRSDEILREREEQLRVIFEASQAGIIMVDARGIIRFANGRMAEMFGMPLDRLVGSPYSEHLHPAMRQEGEERMVRMIRGEIQSVACERHYIREDGGDFWGFLSGRRLENLDGSLRALVGIIADISERKSAEDDLRSSRNLLRSILENVPIRVFWKDTASRYLGCNTSFASDAGFSSPEELLGKDDYQLCWREHAESYRADDRDVMDSGTPKIGFEEPITTSVGHTTHIRTSKVPLIDSDNRVAGLLGIYEDISEQKKLQDQLNQALRIESLGRLAGGVAHDFNNMLGVILGHAELAMKRESITPALREHLEQIRTAANRSADIVRQLLAFARKQTVAPRVLDLNETVESMLRMLGRLIGEDIKLVWHPGTPLWQVKMDPAQMDQVLTNLCVNARDSIPGVGRIIIETGNISCDASFRAGHTGFVPGEYVLLTVSDDGCGMDKEISRRIFEPFFTTKEVGHGTGLGLATVYGIVKQNDGFIDVYSEPGHGTSFKIYLPRYRGGGERCASSESTAPVERGKETLLLVEDEPAILDLGKQMLEMQGYRVLTAGTPGEALRLAQEHIGEIHLVITDVVMPEMNGRDLAVKLRSLYPGLKQLFMSGYTADVIACRGVLEDGVQFIQKPFSFAALTAKVREALDQ